MEDFEHFRPSLALTKGMDVERTRQLVGETVGGYKGIARRVTDGQLTRVRRGAVTRPDELSPEQSLRLRIEAAAPVLNGGTWFSHRSAALIHGLPVLLAGAETVEVVRTLGGHGNRSRHLHARAAVLADQDVMWVDGLPVTSVARTVVHLARSLSFPQAVMVADHALRLGVSREDLLALLGEGRGQRKAERAILFADGAAESPPESESRARIALAGLPVPEIQVELFTNTGEFIARPDFYWRGKRLAGEYDGEGKYTGEYGVTPLDAIRKEKRRHAALEEHGYAVVRWDRRTLRQPGEFERRIRIALASRPWLPANTR